MDSPDKRKKLHRPGVMKIALVLIVVFGTTLSTWVAYQIGCFRREQQASAFFRADVHPGVTGMDSLASVGGPTAEPAPCLTLSELRNGRLYVPIVHVAFGSFGGTPRLDDNAWNQLRSFHYLERLQISRCSIDQNVNADLSGFAHLKSLIIVETPFLPRDIRTATQLPCLRYMMLKKKQGMDKWLPCVGQLRRLQILEIRGDATDKGVASLAALTHLRRLSLNSRGITSRAIPVFLRMKNLKVLELVNTRIDDDGLRTLTGLKHVLALGLDESIQISDKGIRTLAAFDTLAVLSLNGLSITSESARSLSQLTNLRGLMLSKTKFDDAGLRQLASLKNLRVLQLEGTGVVNVGTDLRFPTLEYLNVRNTDLTDNGLKHLSYCSRLRCLDVSRTCITKASIRTIASMQSLVEVYAYGTQIDEESAEWLHLMRELEKKRANEKPHAKGSAIDPTLRTLFELDH